MPPRPRPSWGARCRVYFIGEGEAVKIGVSWSATARLKALEQSTYRRLVILGELHGATAWDERNLHICLDEAALGREWFSVEHPRVKAVLSELETHDEAELFLDALVRKHRFSKRILLRRTQVDTKLGACLRAARELRGLSVADATEQSGVGKSVIQLSESGHNTPTVKALKALAATYGVTLEDLVAGDTVRLAQKKAGAFPPNLPTPQSPRNQEHTISAPVAVSY